ncbi:hypothetical protein AB0K81_27495 [Streptomyces werraensis]|uniref:Uncharacterized protein n=1 Tax=Streptomyces werraensis TaxID=68284 RepID=A0ABV3JMV6_9ACTN
MTISDAAHPGSGIGAEPAVEPGDICELTEIAVAGEALDGLGGCG